MVSVQGPGRIAFDLIVAFAAGPVLVRLGATYDPPVLRHVSRSLGELSYPIYVIHYPLLLLCGSAMRRSGVPYAVWIPIFIGLTACVAWALNRWWDRPIRARLNAWARSAELVAPGHVRPAA
jgi:peptidoglycan/LPS O-acetylase OafA/YrhL